MENFTFYSPTKFVFGKGMESEAGKLVKEFGGSKVLIHYGGGSVVRSGLLAVVFEVVRSIEFISVAIVIIENVFKLPERNLSSHIQRHNQNCPDDDKRSRCRQNIGTGIASCSSTGNRIGNTRTIAACKRSVSRSG